MALGISPVNNDTISLPARARAQTRARAFAAAATRARYRGDKDGGDKDGGGVAGEDGGKSLLLSQRHHLSRNLRHLHGTHRNGLHIREDVSQRVRGHFLRWRRGRLVQHLRKNVGGATAKHEGTANGADDQNE